jgi:hypothetical protein
VWFVGNTTAFAEIAIAHRNDMAAFAAPTPVAGAPAAQPFPPVVEAPAPAVAAAAQDTDDGSSPPIAEPAPNEPPADDEPMTADAREPDQAPGRDEGTENLPTVPETISLAPTEMGEPAPPAERGAAERSIGDDIETVAARRTARAALSRRSRRLQGLTTAILTLIAVHVGLIAWRTDIVRWLPQTASLYAAIGMPVNLRGLDLNNVQTTMDTQDGVPVLIVTGEIASAARRAVEIPRLRFAVRNDRGQEIYAWTALPSRNVMAPGGVLPFRSRLASPPPEGRQMLVRFFNRRDLAAGLP